MRMLIIVLIAFPMLSFVITQTILCSGAAKYSEKNRKQIFLFGSLINVILNLAAIFMANAWVFAGHAPLRKIMELLHFACSYNDIQKAAIAAVIILALSVFWGMAGHFFLLHRLPSFSNRNKSVFLLCSICVLIPVLFAFEYSHKGEAQIQITEICRKTTLLMKGRWDEDTLDENASYIVISNNGSLSYEIDRMYLADNDDGKDRLALRNITIPAGGSYRFEISGDDSLNIKKSGGSVVYLLNSTGKIIDEVTVPALTRDSAYKLENDCWSVFSWKEATGEDETLILVAPPVFSKDGGFYKDAFELTMSSEPGTTIYYTLDCSVPSESSIRYECAINVFDKSPEDNVFRSIQNVVPDYKNHSEIGSKPVDKCFVVRAIAVDANGNKSSIATHSYYIGLDKYDSSRVISLVADPDDLFGENGIYVTGINYDNWYEEALNQSDADSALDSSKAPAANFYKKGRDWERSANLEVFDDTGNLNQAVGIRIQGASARKNALKRFSVYARKEYSGSKWFETNLFDEDRLTHSFYLRAGVNNALASRYAEGRKLAGFTAVPVTVFLNGEYWYDTYMIEKYSEDYFASLYGLNPDNISMQKANYPREISDFISGRSDYEKLNETVDIQSLVDFYCINLYVGNEDYHDTKNFAIWKADIYEPAEYGDTKWRWALYDMDLLHRFRNTILGDREAYVSANWDTSAKINTFVVAKLHDGIISKSFNQEKLWQALQTQEAFHKDFVTTFMDVVNYDFATERITDILAEYGRNISYDDYFFLERPKYIVPYMAEEFELTGTQELVTISSNIPGAPVTLNTIQPELNADNAWTGKYFTDYPVTVTANADNFDHWEVTLNGKTTTYTDETIEVPVVKGGTQIHAIFK